MKRDIYLLIDGKRALLTRDEVHSLLLPRNLIHWDKERQQFEGYRGVFPSDVNEYLAVMGFDTPTWKDVT